MADIELIAAAITAGIVAASGETDIVKAVEKYYPVLDELKRQNKLHQKPGYVTTQEKVGIN